MICWINLENKLALKKIIINQVKRMALCLTECHALNNHESIIIIIYKYINK